LYHNCSQKSREFCRRGYETCRIYERKSQRLDFNRRLRSQKITSNQNTILLRQGLWMTGDQIITNYQMNLLKTEIGELNS
jgi:hypothetical protein